MNRDDDANVSLGEHHAPEMKGGRIERTIRQRVFSESKCRVLLGIPAHERIAQIARRTSLEGQPVIVVDTESEEGFA